MAHTITTQVIQSGSKFVTVKCNIAGDSKDATELTGAVLFDASAYGSKIVSKLFDLEYHLDNFTASLDWDANTDVPLLTIAKSYPYHKCFVKLGGIRNIAGAGITGDILITTVGLASTASKGHIILRISWEE